MISVIFKMGAVNPNGEGECCYIKCCYIKCLRWEVGGGESLIGITNRSLQSSEPIFIKEFHTKEEAW
jgi:hypothetical protein